MHRVGGGASHMIASSSSSMTSDAVLGASHATVSKSAATISADAGSTAISDIIFCRGCRGADPQKLSLALSRSAPLWCATRHTNKPCTSGRVSARPDSTDSSLNTFQRTLGVTPTPRVYVTKARVLSLSTPSGNIASAFCSSTSTDTCKSRASGRCKWCCHTE